MNERDSWQSESWAIVPAPEVSKEIGGNARRAVEPTLPNSAHTSSNLRGLALLANELGMPGLLKSTKLSVAAFGQGHAPAQEQACHSPKAVCTDDDLGWQSG